MLRHPSVLPAASTEPSNSQMIQTWLMCGTIAGRFGSECSLCGALMYSSVQAAIGVGDLGLAYQAFKISISCDNSHAESYSNLGVLELRKNNIEQVVTPRCTSVLFMNLSQPSQARSNFLQAIQLNPHVFEPVFNAGNPKAQDPGHNDCVCSAVGVQAR